MSVFDIIATMLTGTGAISAFVSLIFNFIKNETKSIKTETDKIVNDIQNQSDYDVFKLLYKNVRESTEYYEISKRQASKSFVLAIVSCILGIMVYISGFLIVAFLDKDITIFTTISGTIAELITGLSFWVYNKCTEQLNEYHKRLVVTEKYLTSIQIADKMSDSGKEEMYKWLIQNAMSFDFEQNKSKQNEIKSNTNSNTT